MNSFYDFGEVELADRLRIYKWADTPFAVSVVCESMPYGFATEWVVSGIRELDNSPNFLLKIQMVVDLQRSELEDSLHLIWVQSIRQLAIYASKNVGIETLPTSMKKIAKEAHMGWHLSAHDRMEHFIGADNTQTQRTARMFNLVKSFGYAQAPSVILDYESWSSHGTVLPSTVNRRLHMARQAGLIPNYKPAKDS